MKHLLLKIFVLNFIFVIPLFTQTFWQTTNGPQGCASEAIAVTSEGRIFIDLESGGDFLLFSDDKGTTWNETGQFEYNYDVSTIGITAEDHIFTGGYNQGIFRSTDLGGSWDKTADYFARVLSVSPEGNIWIADWQIYSSFDDGATWNKLPNYSMEVEDIAFDSEGNVYIANRSLLKLSDGEKVESLNLDNTGVSKVFITSSGAILAARGYYDINLFRSVDGGVTWDSLKAGSGVYPTSFIEDFDGNIYLSKNSDGVLKSTDDGITWSQLNEGLNSDNIWDFGIDLEGNIYCVSNVTGVYILERGKTVWREISPNYTQISKIESDKNGNIFAVAFHSGLLFHSSDNGVSWSSPEETPYIGENNFVVSSNGILFKTDLQQILKSEDFGKSWDTVFEDNNVFYRFGNIAISPNDNLYAYRANELIRSTDLGEIWDPIGSKPPVYPYVMNVNEFETIFFGSAHGLYYSDNSGIDWTEAELLAGEAVSGIYSFRSYVFATTYSNAGTGKYGLYFSNDNGKTWNKQNNGLLGGYAKEIAFSNDGKIVYALTDEGFFWSSDYGESWNQQNDGIENFTLNSITVGTDDKIFLGTNGHGVVKSSGQVTSIEGEENEIPVEFSLNQNYPNPFGKSSLSGSNITTIKYTIPNSFSIVHSQLSIYDVLGRKVITLVDKEQTPGSYRVNFDARGLPSGVYFYSLELGGKSLTKKMLILK